MKKIYKLCLIILNLLFISFLQATHLQRYTSGSGSPFKDHAASASCKQFYAQQAIAVTTLNLHEAAREVELLKMDMQEARDRLDSAEQSVEQSVTELSLKHPQSKVHRAVMNNRLDGSIRRRAACVQRYENAKKRLFFAQRREFKLRQKLLAERVRLAPLAGI